MKKYYIAASIVVLTSFALYPLARIHATAARGYDAIGGEPFIIVIGITAAALIVDFGAKREESKRLDIQRKIRSKEACFWHKMVGLK